MESRFCLTYERGEGRLLLVGGGERHDIQIRAQTHRLVQHMVERNGQIGGGAALCTHDELMKAVWADEPMHSREELAKLVWELRRKLEPYDAGHLIENERGVGYRLRTCPPVEAAAGSTRTRGTPGRWPLVAALAALALVAAAAGVVLAARGDGDGPDPELRTFVDRTENVLAQSASGRKEISNALRAGMRCSIPPREAGRRIASVADNRQSILGQLAAFPAPTQEAADAVTALQAALQQSIEADRHYRDGFFAVPARGGCPVQNNEGFRAARRSDARASEAKRRFVTTFNPIAAQFGRATWSAGSF
jgi:DNA-binding winged helix-turn-helix (wHTH) protein